VIIHSPIMISLMGGVHSAWDSELVRVHSPMRTARWRMNIPQRGDPTGETTLPNGDSFLRTAHSPMGTGRWGVYTPQKGVSESTLGSVHSTLGSPHTPRRRHKSQIMFFVRPTSIPIR
jgi:hypothetical protein